MIKSLRLKFGRAPGIPPETIEVTPVTVFVGPNNSGKSRVLSELALYCRTGIHNSTDVILDDVEFEGLDAEEAAKAVTKIKEDPMPGESVAHNHIVINTYRGRMQVMEEQLRAYIQNPNESRQLFCQWFLGGQTLMLDGRNRIALVNPQPAGDLQSPPHSSFQKLFRDNQRREEVRRIAFEAIGWYFVIDPTNLGQLRIRLSTRAPESELEERGIHEAAISFHASAIPVEEMSDGVKAFIGIITEVLAGDPRVILIDEPEAFLHPSLAYRLGLEVSSAAAKANKRLFVSTHSPSFLMGCIQSGAPITIIRLTYRNKIATARVLPNEEIIRLMRNPLLRSTGVLSGLFYEFVVVGESDTDRAFYEEINRRLNQDRPDWGIPNCLFINAQNKQTVPTIVRPLRQLGIPAAGIVDVDVIKEGGGAWEKLLEGMFVPEILHKALDTQRDAVARAMQATGKDMKTEGGIAILSEEDREGAQNLIDILAEYGLFVVPGGEVESWLPELGVTSKGSSWLIKVFERIGEDPGDVAYTRPGDGDVWEFMRRVKNWLVDPNRKGIPY